MAEFGLRHFFGLNPDRDYIIAGGIVDKFKSLTMAEIFRAASGQHHMGGEVHHRARRLDRRLQMFHCGDGPGLARETARFARHDRCVEFGVARLVGRRALAGDVKPGGFHFLDQRLHHINRRCAVFEQRLAFMRELKQMRFGF